MDKKDLEQVLCPGFCSYYRPGKDEELACRGFSVIWQLVADGRDISFIRAGQPPSPDVEELLRRELCSSCPYEEQDCDFAEGKDDAPPCGGFLCLAEGILRGEIPVDDIMKKH